MTLMHAFVLFVIIICGLELVPSRNHYPIVWVDTVSTSTPHDALAGNPVSIPCGVNSCLAED